MEYRRAQRYDWRNYYGRYRRGGRFKALPRGYRRITVSGSIYFYYYGIYFRQLEGVYVVVDAPLGARVTVLPYGYISFWIGPRLYYYVNGTYYIYDPDDRIYVVVREPAGADEALDDGNSQADDLVVYPARGQSAAQRRRDRVQCRNWAVKESGYDPMRFREYSDARRDLYLRALTACLEGRGYVVR